MVITDRSSIEGTRHYYRGRVYEATGDLEIAIEEYQKAIEYGANYADVHNSLGRVLAKKGYLEEARIEFETALRLNPRYIEARKNLDEVLTKLSLLSTKEKELKKGIKKIEPPGEEPSEKVTSEIPTVAEPFTRKEGIKIVKYILYIVPVITVLTLSTIGVLKLISARKIAIQKIYPLDYTAVSCITRYKDKLILSDWIEQELAFYKIINGKITKISTYKLSKDNVVPTSITINNNHLWLLDSWSRKVYKFLLTNSKLVLTKVYNLQEETPIGIIAYKNFLLVGDANEQKISVYDENFMKIESVNFPVDNVINISSYKNKVWLLTKDLYLYKLKGYTEVKNFYPLDLILEKRKPVSTILVDDKFLWLATEGEKKLLSYSKNVLK